MTEILKIKREAGVAGQFGFAVTVQYHPDDPPVSLRFIGSHYGGSVVMELPGGGQTFVRNAERHGEFSEQWVRKFFADR
jgi:hypothetical protein